MSVASRFPQPLHPDQSCNPLCVSSSSQLAEMDRGWGTPPQVTSFHHDEEHPFNSPDSGKKRKFQFEQLGWPTSKHKFRSRRSSPAQGSPAPSHFESEETSGQRINICRGNRKVDYGGPDPSEGSSIDSKSFVAGADSSTSPDTEVHTEMLHEDPVLTASGSKLDSVDSRIAKYADPREKYSGLEDEIQIEHEFEDSDKQILALEGYGEYIEECPDAAIEELMLYTNDAAPNVYGHPSGRWGFKQDARLGARKPTIDQEFEQYFSMMML